MLQEADVACVQVTEEGHSEFTVNDAGMRAMGLTTTVEHRSFGELVRHGPPVQMSECEARIASAPALGEHTEPILAELGYSAEEIERLKDREIIVTSG